MLNASFVKYTGHACHDVSAKLAVLSLQHPTAKAIKATFDLTRQIFEGCPRLNNALPEVLSWHTGRFGGKVSFIVDVIEGRAIGVRDVWRKLPHEHVRSHRRNDCCGSKAAVASMCPKCKVCFCSMCMRGGAGPGVHNPAPRCACYLAFK